MLRVIEIEQFKCFRKLVLPLRPFTLFTGLNASGKSTVLQALVLLHQTAVDAEWSHLLHINGSLLTMGSAADVMDKITGKRECKLAVGVDEGRCEWTFSGRDRRAMAMPLRAVQWTPESGEPSKLDKLDSQSLRHLIPVEWSEQSAPLAELARTLFDLQYVSAERLGPRETYPLTNDGSRRQVGTRGQNAPALLHWLGDEPITDALVIKPEAPTLRSQVQAWMREFFPGASLDVQPVANANLVSLSIRTGDETDYHRPQHVGYGLTHVLPIVVAALIARPGQTLLIENPEVHLHPAGQARMGRFLAQIAATGVQVLVETHSDHVLNGLRRAVRTGVLDAADAAIYFFNRRPREAGDEPQPSQVVAPTIDRQGNLDHWPEGFFDQFDKDMEFFAGWGE